MNKKISLNKSSCIKGMLAVLVLIHHLYQHSGLFHNTLIGSGLQSLGYLSVFGFFFLSGYGIYSTYVCKEKRKCLYFRNRIVPFYLLIIFYIVLYSLERLLIGQAIGIKNIILSLTFGETIIVNGWFMQVQLVLYLMLLPILWIFSSKKLLIGAISVVSIAFSVVLWKCNYLSTAYITIWAFPFGMLWSYLDEKNILILKKKWKIALVGGLFLSLALCLIAAKFITHKAISLCLMSASAFFFMVLILSVAELIRIENRFTLWLGRLSSEIYLTQGLFLTFFHSRLVNISNPYLYVLAVSVCTVGLSIVLQPVTKRLMALVKAKV